MKNKILSYEKVILKTASEDEKRKYHDETVRYQYFANSIKGVEEIDKHYIITGDIKVRVYFNDQQSREYEVSEIKIPIAFENMDRIKELVV